MKTPLRPNTLAVLIHASLVSLFAASTAAATTYTVTNTLDSPIGSGTSGSLRYVIDQAGNGDVINFACAALGCPVTLPISNLGNNGGFPGPTAYAIKGKSITIAAPNPGDVTLQAQPAGVTSASSLRLFFVDTDAGLTLQNLTLTGGLAIGGNGGAAYKGSGGGAAGLGGAIFSQGSLSLEGVSFVDNDAVGGTSLGNPTFGLNFGGGGGLGGDGGGGPSGGGGGTGGNGGISFDVSNYRGLVRYAGKGGAGLNGAGGGTPGGYNLTHPASYPVGPASNGGGGAGGYLWNGGNGTDGGGGGSSGSGGWTQNGGGSGGFGGGGGGNDGFSTFYMACRTTAGNGGFGGGGGSGCLQVVGQGARIGGRGGVGGGGGIVYSNQGTRAGGGAAFGGAVFARSGSVTVRSAGTAQGIAGNSLFAGNGAKNGAAAGRGLFLMSGVPATFDIAGTYTIADDIADDSVASVPAGQSYTPGDGAGAAITKAGPGTLRLDGNNTVAGTTTVTAGTLGGVGSLAGPVSLGSGAAIAPGAPTDVGLFSTGAFTWDGGGTVNVRLGATSAGSDLLRVNGALAKGTAGAHKFHFGVGRSPPVVGTAYTVIQTNDASAFAPGDFSFDTDPAYQNLTGTFSIAGNAVVFTVTGVRTDVIFANGFE